MCDVTLPDHGAAGAMSGRAALRIVLCNSHLLCFPQKKLQEASLKSEQKLKDTEKELRYVVRYIKVSVFFFVFFKSIVVEKRFV